MKTLVPVPKNACPIFVPADGANDASDFSLWADESFPRRIDVSAEVADELLGGHTSVLLFETAIERDCFMAGHEFAGPDSKVSTERFDLDEAADGFCFALIVHDADAPCDFYAFKLVTETDEDDEGQG